jgi:hypothetical protein
MAGYTPLGDLFHDELLFEVGYVDDMRVDLHFRMEMLWGQVRDFAISLWGEDTDGRYELEKADCCDSEVHRHRYYRDGREDRVRILELSPGDEHVVNSQFPIQYGHIVDNWEQIVGRFRGAAN